jgi:hypothetical protein
MPTPFTTEVTDTLYTPEGVPVTDGTLTIANPQTFLSADGFTFLSGFNLIVPVVNGVFSINLVPNQGSTPASTYSVSVRCTDGFFDMTWTVPHSVTPVNLATVAGV